ncbi:MAG TPA: Fe-S protein assembly co-chaperone HscB [Polyangiaceae bacterium]
MSDPFTLLELEPRFDLDMTLLEKRHRELSRVLHPDRYTGRPSGERQQALGRAIEVNEAFRALRDPVRRASVLLARHGRETGESDMPRAEPALLMEVMERREELSEARRSGNRDAVQRLTEAVGERERTTLEAIAAAFAEREPDLARVEALVGELRYHRRFLDEAGAALDDLE